MASIKHHSWIKKLLDDYIDRKFVLPNGELDTTSNTEVITQLTIKQYGWIPENKYQILKETKEMNL